MENAKNLMDVKNMPMYHLHPLGGDRKGQFAIDLGRKLGWRLVIIPKDSDGNEWSTTDVNIIYKLTDVVIIWEVTNHYE